MASRAGIVQKLLTGPDMREIIRRSPQMIKPSGKDFVTIGDTVKVHRLAAGQLPTNELQELCKMIAKGEKQKIEKILRQNRWASKELEKQITALIKPYNGGSNVCYEDAIRWANSLKDIPDHHRSAALEIASETCELMDFEPNDLACAFEAILVHAKAQENVKMETEKDEKKKLITAYLDIVKSDATMFLTDLEVGLQTIRMKKYNPSFPSLIAAWYQCMKHGADVLPQRHGVDPFDEYLLDLPKIVFKPTNIIDVKHACVMRR